MSNTIIYENYAGNLIGEVLKSYGVAFLFTLCGGHISPILAGAKKQGIRVVDVRHEATAVFAADAVSRLTGVPGVAAVTAGPGLTNSITAIKNAQLAQSPVIIMGGATASLLKGRGSLQDIDQMALLRPHVKWLTSVKRIRDIVPTLDKAFQIAQSGVPGPVFLEYPLDVTFPEELIRAQYGTKSGQQIKGIGDKIVQWYVTRHFNSIFSRPNTSISSKHLIPSSPTHSLHQVDQVISALKTAHKPVMLVGSQSVINPQNVASLVDAIEAIGIPVYLSGMARGLLGKNYQLQFRQQRKQALREADLVLLAGVPCDFRLDYGNHIRRSATLISINRSKEDLMKNRRPQIPILADPAAFIITIGGKFSYPKVQLAEWFQILQDREQKRLQEINTQEKEQTSKYINPLVLCQKIEQQIDEKSILVADGGDFVATASYIIQPRHPLNWLDPGVYGTLGIGAGFALAAKLCHPESEVWIIYGDGSAGYGIPEWDTFVRHNIAIIAVIGNDAGWTQIRRDQEVWFNDDVATVLGYSNYHEVVKGFGGEGFLINDSSDIEAILERAKKVAKAGKPVLVNALISKTDFRKGSLSV